MNEWGYTCAPPTEFPNLTLGCRGICIYRTGDLEQTRELASSDPAVKAGQLEIQAMQWLTRPGALLEKGK